MYRSRAVSFRQIHHLFSNFLSPVLSVLSHSHPSLPSSCLTSTLLILFSYLLSPAPLLVNFNTLFAEKIQSALYLPSFSLFFSAILSPYAQYFVPTFGPFLFNPTSSLSPLVLSSWSSGRSGVRPGCQCCPPLSSLPGGFQRPENCSKFLHISSKVSAYI